MRILLDACVPKRLAAELTPHAVRTVPEMGWSDLDDGPLLQAISGQFDVFVSVDKGLPHQQSLATRPFGVIILRAPSNRLADLLPLVPQLLAQLVSIRPGEVHELTI